MLFTRKYAMPEEQHQESNFEQLFQKGLQHLETRWEYFSLTATEKMSGIASALAGALVIFIFSLIILFFFSIGFALWLGDYFHRPAAGFAVAGLIFVPIAAGTYYWIRPFVRDKIIQTFLEDDNNDNTGTGK